MPDTRPAVSAGCIAGVDVSSYNSVASWLAVRQAGYEIAYCKATEGVTYADPAYSAHMNGAKDAGLRVGWYHFWRPNDDAVRQAEWALRQGGWRTEWLLPMLDLEVVAPGQEAAYALAAVRLWLVTVERALGVPPVLYTNPSTWRALGNDATFTHWPLWVADYGVPSPPALGGWGADGWRAWQYSSADAVPGIPDPTDRSWWKA